MNTSNENNEIYYFYDANDNIYPLIPALRRR